MKAVDSFEVVRFLLNFWSCFYTFSTLSATFFKSAKPSTFSNRFVKAAVTLPSVSSNKNNTTTRLAIFEKVNTSLHMIFNETSSKIKIIDSQSTGKHIK